MPTIPEVEIGHRVGPQGRRRMKRILIIDDDEDLVGRMVEFLRQEGYDATVATTVENGLLLAGYGLPDLVLLDLALNSDCGLNLLEILRRGQKTAHLPVTLI